MMDSMGQRMFLLVMILGPLSFCFSQTLTASGYDAELVYSFVSVDYDWSDENSRQQALDNQSYIMENNIITGIKVYKGQVYVTVPRWRNGVPSTLNRLVQRGNRTLLSAFPSWDMNRIGYCDSLQYVQSMEIDPNTGWMWIIDTGRINILAINSSQRNLCPPKLLVYSIDKGTVELTYEFPADIVSPTTNFMNDIVLDYVDGEVKYAYITDTRDAKLYVFDYKNMESYYFQHNSMNTVPLDIPTQTNLLAAPIDGIAMSSDFSWVYYSTLSARTLYAISTAVLRDKNANFSVNVELVGQKAGSSDGLAFGQTTLYYGAFEKLSVYRAKVGKDGMVQTTTQTAVLTDTDSLGWVDTLAFDRKHLWLVANDLNRFAKGQMIFNGSRANMYIWKVNIDEEGYLHNAALSTITSGASTPLYCHWNCLFLVSISLKFFTKHLYPPGS